MIWHTFMLLVLVLAAVMLAPIRIKGDAEIADDIREDLIGD